MFKKLKEALHDDHKDESQQPYQQAQTSQAQAGYQQQQEPPQQPYQQQPHQQPCYQQPFMQQPYEQHSHQQQPHQEQSYQQQPPQPYQQPAYTPASVDTPPAAASYTPASVSTHTAAASPSRFASMSMHSSDRLRFINFPRPVIDQCRDICKTHWKHKRGIKSERDYGGSWEFDFDGSPWGSPWGSGDVEFATTVRRMIRGILQGLLSSGWVLHLATDISKKAYDKDMLIFRKVPEPVDLDWCCVSFSSQHKMRFIDAPADLYNNMIAPLASIIPIKEHKEQIPGVYEYKFRGTPWYADGTETMVARRLLLALMEGMDAGGWTVYTSIDHKSSGESDYTSDADTWYCCRPKGWTSGMPLYHQW